MTQSSVTTQPNVNVSS